MRLLERGADVIGLLSNNESLISSELKRIKIEVDNEILIIELYFNLRYSEIYPEVMLKFISVTDYSFSWSNSHFFYNVETLKLLENNGSYYISLDPFQEVDDVSEYDNDFITSLTIECFAI